MGISFLRRKMMLLVYNSGVAVDRAIYDQTFQLNQCIPRYLWRLAKYESFAMLSVAHPPWQLLSTQPRFHLRRHKQHALAAK
jgi:hypothetical protein